MNSILVTQRHVSVRKHAVAMNNEGFWYYVGSILNLHSKQREFASGAVWVGGPGGGHAQRSEGMWRLATINPSRVSRNNKYQGSDFRKSVFVRRIFGTSALLYQGVSALYIYIKRVSSIGNATLSIDHFTGIYAICGTVLELATLIILAQPYEWTDNNNYIESERLAMPDVDTSNAWVYEGFSSVVIHSLIWTVLRVYTFLQADSVTLVQLKAVFSGPGIAVIVLGLAIGVPFMTPTIWGVAFRPSREGLVWLNKYFKLGYKIGGQVFRLLLLVVAAAVATLVWLHAIFELLDIKDGRLRPWNVNWNVVNPGTKSFYGVILSVWS